MRGYSGGFMKIKNFIAVFCSMAILTVLIFSGCVEFGTLPPAISQHPVGATYLLGDAIAPLTVTATASGELTYQWYRANSVSIYNSDKGTPIKGATSSSYKPSFTAAGVNNYFYCVVSANGLTAKSNYAQIIINDPFGAQFPVIIKAPENATYYAGEGLAVTINVQAITLQQGGAITYQWYSAPDTDLDLYDDEGQLLASAGTLITGATSAVFSPSGISNVGSWYYYVIVTNTVGTDTAKLASEIVTIKVIATEDKTSNATINVNFNQKYQYIRGFGGMDTPWGNVPGLDLEDYETMFNPADLGYNILRIMILPDNEDYNITLDGDGTEEKPGILNAGFDKTPGTNDPGRPFYIKGPAVVNKYGGYVFAAPWSPPAVWKSNNSINGGATLRTANYVDFAAYLKRFAEIMLERGAPVYAISMQNEWTYRQTTYAGCEYTNEEHAAWWNNDSIRHFTSMPYDASPDPVKGWGGGREIEAVQTMSGEAHNEFDRLESVIANTASGNKARQAIDILGRHIYGAGITAAKYFPMAHQHPSDPKEVWMTEHNINSGDDTALRPRDATWNYIWPFVNEVDLTLRLNLENAFVWWTAKRWYSMIGDGQFTTIEGARLPRGHALSQYSKFAKETGRLGVTVNGNNATGGALTVNPAAYSQADNAPKITAYVTLNDKFYEDGVTDRNKRWMQLTGQQTGYSDTLKIEDISAISVLICTPVTPSSGSGGTNMGTVRIKLPEGFIVRSATAMRSSSAASMSKYEDVTVGTDRNSAYVTMPANQMLSVRFYR